MIVIFKLPVTIYKVYIPFKTRKNNKFKTIRLQRKNDIKIYDQQIKKKNLLRAREARAKVPSLFNECIKFDCIVWMQILFKY